MRIPIACSLLFGLLGPAFSDGADERTFREPSDVVFTALGVEPGACGEVQTVRYAGHVAVRCGTTSEAFPSFKKSWRRAVRRQEWSRKVRWDGAPWAKAGDARRSMHAFVGPIPLEIVVGIEDGSVSLAWPRTYPGCHSGHEVTWDAETEDGIVPVPESRQLPEFPEEARKLRTGGVVMGSFLVDETGSVVDVCVVAAAPRGVGFERAATDALLRTKYTPATRDGQAVAMVARFWTEFEIHGAGGFSAAVVREFFDSVRRPED